ncbi:MAG: ABC transporter permease [Fimbriimonadaceae bacterium]|nr:ABC transporter permease [Fimbriimonadaceae bacterium]
MLDYIEFLLSEAFVSLGRNRWMSFAAITTAAMALLLFGGLGSAYFIIKAKADELPSKFEITAFYKDNVTREKAQNLTKQIAEWDELQSAILVKKEDAWSEMSDRMPEITEGIPNPLPDTVRVRTKDLSMNESVVARLKAIPEIGADNVKHLAEEQDVLLKILYTIRVAGFALGGLMLFTSGILIYNAIRMTVVARRREHRIMHLVGATRATVILPLLIEGLVQGLIGGLLATIFFWGTFAGSVALLQGFGAYQVAEPFPFWPALFGFLGAGGVYGLICSALAVRGHGSTLGQNL